MLTKTFDILPKIIMERPCKMCVSVRRNLGRTTVFVCFLQFIVFFLKSVVMHLDIAARMGIKDAKAGAYQNHGLTMAKKIVMMVQMKKVGVNFI